MYTLLWKNITVMKGIALGTSSCAGRVYQTSHKIPNNSPTRRWMGLATWIQRPRSVHAGATPWQLGSNLFINRRRPPECIKAKRTVVCWKWDCVHPRVFWEKNQRLEVPAISTCPSVTTACTTLKQDYKQITTWWLKYTYIYIFHLTFYTAAKYVQFHISFI